MQSNEMNKDLSPLEAWALALGCIIGFGSFVMPGTTFLPSAGPAGTAIAIAVACAVMSIFAVCFHFMMNRMPVDGGPFSYAQRVFGRGHGFFCGWLLSLAYLALVPMNATALALAARNLMGNVLEVGFHYNLAGYETYLGEIVIIAIVLAVFAFIAIRRRTLLPKLQVVLVALLIIGVAVIFAACLVSPATSTTALQPAFSPEQPANIGVLVVLAASPWLFIGFDAVAQSTAEFSFSPRKAGFIMVSAIVVGGLIYIALNTVGASATPPGYSSWFEYVQDTPNLTGIESVPVYYAAQQTLGNAGIVALDLAIIGALLGGVVGFTLASSRLLYSMAKAQVLPRWFGELHPKYGTPRNAITFIFGISVVAALFGRTILNWLVDMSSIGAIAGFFYTCMATATLARREQRRGMIALGIVGALLSLGFAALLLIPIPGLNTHMSLESFVFLIAWITLGINFYTPAEAVWDEGEEAANARAVNPN